MNTTMNTQKRLAFFCTPTRTRVNWVNLDQTGQPPRIVTALPGTDIRGRYELISLDDAPLAVYRFGSDEIAPDYDRDALAALAEIVRVVNGMPNVSADVDEQIRQLREQLRTTVDNAEEMLANRDAQIAYDEHRIKKIIEQAHKWKQRAQQRKIYIEHYQQQEISLHAEIRGIEDKLQVARNAVERAVNRSNHSNEHVENARDRANHAELATARARDEIGLLREQVGQATAEAHDLRERIVAVQANALDTINRVAAALPDTVVDAEIVEPPFELTTFYSADGDVPVVEIDTSNISGRLRVTLNEGVIWDGDTETDERPGASAERLPWENITTRAECELTSTISRQLDTIRDQAEKIERLESERDAEEHRANSAERQLIAATDRLENAQADAIKLRQERDGARERAATFDRELSESETMRKRLDERLADERRVYETTSAALRAMIRERDAVLDVAERAIYPHAHGETKSRLIGEYRDARGRLPRLDTEADAREDEAIRKMIAAVDQAVRFWRRSPANVMTEQLNIALSNLADSIQPNS